MHWDRQRSVILSGMRTKTTVPVVLLFSTVIEEKNERKAFEIGPNAHFYLDENVVWDLHFVIFF